MSRSYYIYIFLFLVGIFVYQTGMINYYVIINDEFPTSMLELDQGDVIITVHTPAEHLKIGDIVVLISSTSSISSNTSHRIQAIVVQNNSYYFLIKGDNPTSNSYLDNVNRYELIPYEYISGKVILILDQVAILPYVVEKWKTEFLGYIILLTSLFVLIITTDRLLQNLVQYHSHNVFSKSKRGVMIVLLLSVVTSVLLPQLFLPVDDEFSITVVPHVEALTIASNQDLHNNKYHLIDIFLTIPSQILTAHEIKIQLYDDIDFLHSISDETSLSFSTKGNLTLQVALLVKTNLASCQPIFYKIEIIKSTLHGIFSVYLSKNSFSHQLNETCDIG